MSDACRSFNTAFDTFLNGVSQSANTEQLEQSLAAVFKAREELHGLNEFEMDRVIEDMVTVGEAVQSCGLKLPVLA